YYFGTDGSLKDARTEVGTYEAIERMHDMAEEGLISASFINNSQESSSTMLENDLGVVSYAYNQAQTIMNATKLQTGEKYMAAMVPVARWFDGTNANGVYMRFTESWRSIKTDAWAISKAGVGANQDKLQAALKIFDYAFSEEGQILMSYGPDAFIKRNAAGSYVTFNFNGKQMPVIADETSELLWKLASGNYTNFARYYLGSTLSFAKSQAFEYQCTNEIGKEGAGYISTAIGLGTIKHPELAVCDNMWYTSTPTVLPTTKVENDTINQYTQLQEQFNEGKGKYSVIVEMIQKGYVTEGVNNASEMAAKVTEEWGGAQALMLRNGAWKRLASFYSNLNK
ncbi:MAG: hypothetical protein KBS81_06090, partial [Spirochaetales bacterium]|nr:hypothetical protein [Candidatus Physcosoma equi]